VFPAERLPNLQFPCCQYLQMVIALAAFDAAVVHSSFAARATKICPRSCRATSCRARRFWPRHKVDNILQVRRATEWVEGLIGLELRTRQGIVTSEIVGSSGDGRMVGKGGVSCTL